MKSFMAVSDGGSATEALLRLATDCATRFGGALDVVHVRERGAPPMIALAGDPHGAMMMGAVLDQHDADSDALQASARAAFDRIAASSGATWHLAEDKAELSLPRRARLADLVLLSRPATDPSNVEPRYVARLLLETRRPTLLVPARETSWPPRSALIAWNDSAPATLALAASVPLLRLADRVAVLSIGRPQSRADPAGVVAYLARHGIAAGGDAFDPGPGSARGRGRALLAYADSTRADLLVMGAYGEGRLANFLGLGGATGKVITAAKMPVLVAH